MREILLIYNKNNGKVWEIFERKDLFNINFNKILNENDYSKHNDIYSLKLFSDLNPKDDRQTTKLQLFCSFKNIAISFTFLIGSNPSP